MNKPNFKGIEFDHFRMQAVLPSSFCECESGRRKLGVKVVDILEPYNKFSALFAQKICYLRLLSPLCGGLRRSAGFGNDTMMILDVSIEGKRQ